MEKREKSAKFIPIADGVLSAKMEHFLSRGLRSGLLLAYREHLGDAISFILRFPDKYHHHIREEFGRWMGQNLGDDTGAVTELAGRGPAFRIFASSRSSA